MEAFLKDTSFYKMGVYTTAKLLLQARKQATAD